MAACRTCALPLAFVRMESGTLMPINPGPNPDGTVAGRKQGARLVRGYIITADRPLLPGWTPFQAHWAICPGAPTHRTPKPTRRDVTPALF